MNPWTSFKILAKEGFFTQVTVPSMASVFNEYALKSQYDTSIYLQVTSPWLVIISLISLSSE